MNATKALLVIDVQQGLFQKTRPIYRAEQLLQNINALIDRARRSATPVIFIQHANDSFLAHGSAGWQLHPHLQPAETDLRVHKHHGNAFERTPLHHELAARGVTTVVVTGLVTHGCVKATCLGAEELGYSVVLVSDGHSNFDEHAARMIDEWNRKLSESGVELRSTHEVTF